MSYFLSIIGAKEYLKEWMDIRSIKLMDKTVTHYIFTGKTLQGVRMEYKVLRNAMSMDIGESFEIYSRYNTEDQLSQWEWADSIYIEKGRG